MRIIIRILLILFAIAILAVSLANRQSVTLALGPDLGAYGLPAAPTLTLPLFLIVLGVAGIGFILGAGREYFREGRHRRTASERAQQVAALRRENAALRERVPGDETDRIIEALPVR